MPPSLSALKPNHLKINQIQQFKNSSRKKKKDRNRYDASILQIMERLTDSATVSKFFGKRLRAILNAPRARRICCTCENKIRFLTCSMKKEWQKIDDLRTYPAFNEVEALLYYCDNMQIFQHVMK